MVAIQWSPSFATGIREIDEQHRRLVGYINELHSIPGDAPAALSRILESAIDYTLYHFAFEEAVMEDAGYRLLDAHKRLHDQFREQLRELKAQSRSGAMPTDSLKEALARWLFDHISKTDTVAMGPPRR